MQKEPWNHKVQPIEMTWSYAHQKTEEAIALGKWAQPEIQQDRGWHSPGPQRVTQKVT